MTDLNGRRVVITGASRGVGFESCKRMMELLEKPFDVTGKFFHGSEELMF